MERLSMRHRTLTLFAVAALLAACKPAVPVKDLMAKDVQPSAQAYWDSVRFISDETGDHDIFPRTDAEWQKTREAAAKLAELGEQLKSSDYSAEHGPDWIEFSDGMIQVAGKAEQAAIDKDVDAVFEVGGTLYSVCSACHQAYLPREQAAEVDAAN